MLFFNLDHENNTDEDECADNFVGQHLPVENKTGLVFVVAVPIVTVSLTLDYGVLLRTETRDILARYRRLALDIIVEGQVCQTHSKCAAHELSQPDHEQIDKVLAVIFPLGDVYSEGNCRVEVTSCYGSKDED